MKKRLVVIIMGMVFAMLFAGVAFGKTKQETYVDKCIKEVTSESIEEGYLGFIITNVDVTQRTYSEWTVVDIEYKVFNGVEWSKPKSTTYMKIIEQALPIPFSFAPK